MNLVDLYELQSVLDAKVTERLSQDYDTASSYCVDDKIYAFHTEVHELANEIGFFKFWKLGHTKVAERILDELVDCVHFLLSIGLTKGYSRIVKNVEPFALWEDYSFYDMFAILRENNLSNVAHFVRAFELVVGIGAKLGISEHDIYEGYRRKNTVNIERQNGGY